MVFSHNQLSLPDSVASNHGPEVKRGVRTRTHAPPHTHTHARGEAGSRGTKATHSLPFPLTQSARQHSDRLARRLVQGRGSAAGAAGSNFGGVKCGAGFAPRLGRATLRHAAPLLCPGGARPLFIRHPEGSGRGRVATHPQRPKAQRCALGVRRPPTGDAGGRTTEQVRRILKVVDVRIKTRS